jgi:bacterioferritin (cytochrome b1)
MATEDPNTTLGRNRTGLAMSPLHGEMLLTGATHEEAQDRPDALTMNPETTLMAELRAQHVNQADALGSIPPPTTLKGMATSGAGAIKNQRMHVFIDKLAERLAYERGGTRLYDAALVKVVTLAAGTPVKVDRVKQIRNQEIEHAGILQQAIVELGADPTAQTPCADLVGVQSMGLMQSVTDPRTSLVQTLSSLLAAELIDVASWELLSRLARDLGQDALAERFDHALEQENQHLTTISRWYEALITAESRLVS